MTEVASAHATKKEKSRKKIEKTCKKDIGFL
jgi:hypothetical protein